MSVTPGKVPHALACHEPRIHGGVDDNELRSLGLEKEDLLDFSVNTNPYGPNPALVEAMDNAVLDQYPDPTDLRPREALARHLGLTADTIILGNGAADLLWTLARTLLPTGTGALVVEPTFCEFRAACMAAGAASVGEWRAKEETGFAMDPDAVAASARAQGARVIYLCSPNTPTATVVPVQQIATWADRNPWLTLILDESFLSLSERASDAAIPMPPNVVRVRSLTKDHGIPGVRVGYAIATPGIVAAAARNRPAWTVNALAQAACLATCEAENFIGKTRTRLLRDREKLAKALRTLGLHPLPSSTNFLLVRIGNAARLRRRLLEGYGILVRDCASFDLPDFIRLCARPAPDLARLVTALHETLPRHRGWRNLDK